MFTILQSILGGLLRYVLAGVISWLITNGIADEEQVTQLIAGVASALALVGWLAWVKLRDRSKVLTALAMPKGTTLHDLDLIVKGGVVVPAMTPDDAVPTPVKSEQYVSPRSWLLPILLISAIGASACIKLPSVQVPHPPAPTEEQIQAVRAKAVQMLAAVEQVGELVAGVHQATHAAAEATLITPAQRDVIYQHILDLAPRVVALIDITETVTADPDLRVVVRALMGVVDRFLADLQSTGHPALQQSASAIRAALAVASAYLGGEL